MSHAAAGMRPRDSGATVDAPDRYQRIAWIVLGAAFLVFCGLGSGGLYAAVRYSEHAATQNLATLKIAYGTKLEVQSAGQKTWRLTENTTLKEGDSVRTGQDTDAWITMFDGSTIHLYYSSTITLKVMRTSQFLNQFKTIELVQQGGSIKAAAAAPDAYAAMKFHVFSEDGRIVVTIPGSSTALITVPDPLPPDLRMTVSTQVGEVSVRDEGAPDALPIPIGMQRRVFAGGIVFKQETAATDLIKNGDFKLTSDPIHPGTDFAPGWHFAQSLPALDALHVYSDIVTDTVTGGPVAAAHFARTVTTTDLATIDIRQELDQQVNYYQTLTFQAAVEVAYPQAPTGVLYPLTLIVNYVDVDGKPGFWVRKFYAQEGARLPFDGAAPTLPLPPALWAELPPGAAAGWDLMAQSPQPARIKAVTIEVSGYSFNVYVRGLHLTGQ